MSSQKRKVKKSAFQPKLSAFISGNHSKPPNRSYCECPLCGLSGLPRHMLNIHVDLCLDKMERERNRSAKRSDVQLGESIDNSTRAKTSHTVNIQTQENGDLMANDIIPIVERQGDIPGLLIIKEFISVEEENAIINAIETDGRTPWHESSFNGRCLSKNFGVRTQFGLPNEERCVRKNNPAAGEHDIPEYLTPYPLRLKALVSTLDHVPIELKTFTPNECNCNCYLKVENHYLKPHYDDRALSGPLLMNLSMGSAARMTYISPSGQETAVYLPRRCLQIVIGPARWTYQHCIRADDVLGDKRVSVTWRHSASKQKGIREKLHHDGHQQQQSSWEMMSYVTKAPSVMHLSPSHERLPTDKAASSSDHMSGSICD